MDAAAWCTHLETSEKWAGDGKLKALKMILGCWYGKR